MATTHVVLACHRGCYTSLTNHVLADVGHGVELFLADLARELLLGVAVHNLDVLVQRPELLEGFVTGDALEMTHDGR